MSVKAPTPDQLRAAAADLHLPLSDDDVDAFGALVGDVIGTYYRALDGVADDLPEVRYPRTPGRRPDAEEDPLHAWYVKTSIKGAPRGPLAGRKVALKDTVCLAGVPMMDGASSLEGYVPEIDATIVTRILDAGGEIVGKTHCEYFCFSGGSHTNATGPTHNPHKRGYSAGGSSSGSAAVVGAGEVEMAIGGDQGGSIREPAAFCGIYGMKATHGLVPYTGVFATELTLDHVGPMTATVADNALLLEVIAGADGLDPRQQAPVTAPYTEALGKDIAGLRVGVVREGFGHAHSEPDVDAAVRKATAQLAKLGAIVEEISVPLHRQGMHVWVPIAVEGTTEVSLKGNAHGTNWRGAYLISLIDAHGAWRARAHSFPDGLKMGILLAQYMQREYRNRYYAKAQNLSRRLRGAYDDALARYDLLAMPTAPVKAPPLPPDNPTREQWLAPGFDPITNTAPFNCTGHPAMSLPCAMSDGLPVGLMLIGRMHDEMTIYRAAHAFEQATDWRKLRP